MTNMLEINTPRHEAKVNLKNCFILNHKLKNKEEQTNILVLPPPYQFDNKLLKYAVYQ